MRTNQALRLPASLQAAVEALIKVKRTSHRQRVDALSDLFELFTNDRSQLARFDYLADPRLRSAYLRYHLPLNFIRSLCVLRSLEHVASTLDALKLVVDIGAGPGASSLATRSSLSQIERKYLLTDRSRSALKIANELHTALVEDAKPCKLVVDRLPNMPRIEEPALVWMSMVLNELSMGDRRGVDPIYLARQLGRAIPTGSVLILVEPALREPSRDLMDFRAVMLENPGWRILGPCTHEADCPLLDVPSRPWCHFHARWQPPSFVSDVAKPLNLEAEQCSFSFLAFERVKKNADQSPAEAAPKDESAKVLDPIGRAVGDPMDVRSGKRGIYVCKDGVRELETAEIPDVSRGDVLAYGETTRVLSRWPGTRSSRGETKKYGPKDQNYTGSKGRHKRQKRKDRIDQQKADRSQKRESKARDQQADDTRSGDTRAGDSRPKRSDTRPHEAGNHAQKSKKKAAKRPPKNSD